MKFSGVLIALCFWAPACFGVESGGDWLVDHHWKMDGPSSLSVGLAMTPDGASLELKNGSKGPLFLEPSDPIAIPAAAKRLTLWANPAAMGNAAPWRGQTASIHARVRDVKGAIFRYSFSMGSLNNRGWGMLSTEALSLCPNQLPWTQHPQPPLTLMGLEVQVGPGRLKAVQLHGLATDSEEHRLPARPWQIVSLTDPADREAAHSWQGAGIEYTGEGWGGAPYLTMDALADGPGSYKIGVRMREAWEGPVIAEWKRDITMPVANFEMEKRQRFVLDVPHPGTYFLEIRTWKEDLALSGLRYYLLIVPDGKGGSTTDASHGDGQGGYLDLQTAPVGHVFGPDETLAFNVQVELPPLPGKKNVHVVLTDYQFNRVKEETLSIPLAASKSWTVKIEFPKRAAEACRAFVELKADDTLVDKDSLILGKTAAAVSDPSTAAPVGEQFFCGVTSSSFLVNAVAPEGLDELSRVSRGMDQAVLNGNRIVEIEMPWRDLEPLRGVFQFDLLDKILMLAKSKGLKVMIAPWFLSDHTPRWLYADIACYEDCTSMFILGSQFSPSASDPAVQQGISGLWTAIVQRFRGNPALAGYLACGPSLDLGYWHTGVLHHTDYSPSAVEDFQHYLNEIRHYSLQDISSRYGETYSSWTDVLPPAPNWDSDFDFRSQWADFCAYQQWELYRWMERDFQAIRAEDPVHAIYQYQYVGYGPQETYYPLFQKYRVSATTGGSEGMGYLPFIATYNLWGLNSRGGETIQTVEKWNLYSSLFNMLAFGGGGAYYEVQWHTAFPEPWDTEPEGAKILKQWSSNPEGGWLLRVKDTNFSPDFAKWSKIFDELGGTQAMPMEAGSFYSWDRNLYQYRWMNPYSITGGALQRAWEEKDHRLPRWISDESPEALYSEIKMLVVDSDTPAMTGTTAEKLAAYVKGGGCLVTFAPAGKYTVETGKADFGFLAGLGFADMTVLRSSTATGTMVSGTGLFAGDRLGFKSLYRARVDAGTEILERLPDGSPCVVRRQVGAGDVVLFLGELDWEESGDILGALCRDRGINRWCDATNPRVHVYCLQKGETRYVVAHFAIYNYGQPLKDFVGKETVRTMVSISNLCRSRYSVVELNEGRDLGEFSAEQLGSGIEIEMQSGETKVLRCSPVGGM